MGRAFRRLITGHDSTGRSVLVSETLVAEAASAGNFDLWTTGDDAAAGPFPFFPAPGNMIFRVFRIPPAAPTTPSGAELAALADRFFAEVGDPGCRLDTCRHPLMHRTPTVDCVMLLQGEAALLLDEGEPIPLRPLDVVVQRATNHTWLNTGRADVIFLAVMIGVA
jgi:hypothetical protein